MAPRKLLQLSDLVDDIVFEIFLAFVAIDWDGPFTLTLVCTKWRDFVISHPRLWTWIKVDDTQADWKERIDISAYLSKELPLHICLRIPFTSACPMTYITRRCMTLILESDSWHSSEWAKMWPDFLQDSTFREDLSEAERNSIAHFLKGALKDQIRILRSDGYPPCSYYPMWTIYDDCMAGRSPSHLMESPYSVTALLLTTERGEQSAAPLQLSQLWRILPSLSRLGYLDISDSIIEANSVVTLSPLTLPSLQSLVLSSATSHRGISSSKGDIWLGLFSILDYLTAPRIEHMLLRGSVHGILAVMMRATISIRPSDLVIDISSFDEPLTELTLEPNPAWYKLVRLTIGLPASENARSCISVDNAVTAIRSLLFFVVKKCSIRVYTDEALMEPLGLQHTLEDNIPQTAAHLNNLRSLAMAIAYSSESILFQTRKFTEGIAVDGQQLVTKSLDLYTNWWPHSSNQRINNGLSYLGSFRCSPSLLNYLLSAKCRLKSLRALTLFDNGWGGEEAFSELVSTLLGCADSLPHLNTISIETVYAWRPLIELLGNFGKAEGRGISTLNLPCLPRPFILREIVSALNNRVPGYSKGYPDRLSQLRLSEKARDWREYEMRDAPGCWECFKKGWTCFDSDYIRTSKSRIVSITKDSICQGIDL